jgi:hypothetical protein
MVSCSQFSQRPGSFNGRNRPRLRRSDGLHSRRLDQPRFDGEFTAAEAWRFEQELDDIAMPGPDFPGRVCLDEAAGERREPARRSGEHHGGARDDLLDGGIASEECLGKRRQESPVRYDQRRGNTPTSPTLREEACVLAQRTLTRRNLSPTRSPGVTPERLNRTRELDRHQAWSIPPPWA